MGSFWRQEGAGDYTHIKWQHSELVNWLTHHSLDGEIYSSAADLIYLKTGVVAQAVPSRNTDLAIWRKRLPSDKKHYGVWFAQSFRTYLSTPEELATVFQLRPVFLRDSEVLYELK